MPPQGFGPLGQNPRRHPGSPRVFRRSRKNQKNLDFWEHGSQRIAECSLGVEYTREWFWERSLCHATRFWSPNVSAYSFLDRFRFICWKIASKSIRSRVKIGETRIAYRGLWGNSHCSSMSLTERQVHTWICHTQISPNWARKTRKTIQKYIQWLRKGQGTGLVTRMRCDIGIFAEF